MSNELPHILSAIDRENRDATIRVLSDEHANDELCLRLGRAFLKGRLDAFTGVHDETKWPCPSVDECNLYAGGYQYDHGNPMDELRELFEQLPEGESKDKVMAAKEIMDGLAALERQEKAHGLTLELLSQRCDLRFKLQTMTIDNLGHAQAVMQVHQKMEGTFAEMLQRRGFATGKPNASDNG
jgi:hypothetical protein